MDNFKDFDEKVEKIEKEIATLKENTLKEYNEKYKEYIGKKVKISMKSPYMFTPAIEKGFFGGFINEYGKIRPSLKRPKKDGTMSKNDWWFYFSPDCDFEIELI